jgi:DivIVA domain-containing protein
VTWFFAVLVVLVMGAVAVVASGRGGSLGPAYDDRADVRLPADRPVTGEDLRGLRFNTALRGYRASEVDALIEVLAAQLDRDRPGPTPHPFTTVEHEALETSEHPEDAEKESDRDDHPEG